MCEGLGESKKVAFTLGIEKRELLSVAGDRAESTLEMGSPTAGSCENFEFCDLQRTMKDFEMRGVPVSLEYLFTHRN